MIPYLSTLLLPKLVVALEKAASSGIADRRFWGVSELQQQHRPFQIAVTARSTHMGASTSSHTKDTVCHLAMDHSIRQTTGKAPTRGVDRTLSHYHVTLLDSNLLVVGTSVPFLGETNKPIFKEFSQIVSTFHQNQIPPFGPSNASFFPS